jgi:protein ImuB
MLWACLLLPSLSLDVFARALPPAEAARPFAVTTGGHYPRIVAVNAAAREAAVMPEQLVSASLALAPGIVLRDRDLKLEAAALAGVAAWATQFTPTVSLMPPDAVQVEIGGCLRLFGGLERLAAQLAHGAQDLGYSARLALAPTPLAALLFAREMAARHDFTGNITDGRRGLEQGSLFKALAPLRLAHLDVAPDIVATLSAAGVTTFGRACALPREGLARRVGADFVATLDRARGLVPDPRPPFVPPPRYEGRLDLPAPVANVEALAFATNRLVHELAGWLAGHGLGVLEISLTLAHERYVGVKTGVPATTVHFALAAPAREPSHLLTVLRERLARVTLPALVEGIALASEVTAPLAGRNLGLLPGDEAAATVPLIDRLRARLGEDAVALVAPRAEHRPERASADSKSGIRVPVNASRNKPKGEKVESDPSLPAFPPRPVWLLSEPAPLDPLIEVQPWVLRDGPERIESGWWDGADVRRDYFIAETPRGETVWIYRDHRYGIDDGEWFLHGVFA